METVKFEKDSSVKQTVQLSIKEYSTIQIALWALQNEIKTKMAQADNQADINELYVYAQEVTELKHDLKDAFSFGDYLKF
jgi:hypothetical protein